MSAPLGLYLHVPFCAKACEYCAFYQEKPDSVGIKQYIEAVEHELTLWPPQRGVSTIFMGGGTPSLLSAIDLTRLCAALKATVERSWAGQPIPPIEWSIEIAPSTLKADKLEVLLAAGVNRFSLGVQSFNPATLEAIGRPHSLAQIEAALALLKAAHVPNWNIDLIFAAAEETLESWRADLTRAVAENPNHISTYCLTFESDTKLFLKMLKGQKRKPTAEEEAHFYRATWDFFKQAGYTHYEISNFARLGFHCQHNLNTWNMHQWVAYGPSGAMQLEGAGEFINTTQAGSEDVKTIEGLRAPQAPRQEGSSSCTSLHASAPNSVAQFFHRATNIADLTAWQKGILEGQRALTDTESLTARQMTLDGLIFGLRLIDGVDVAALQSRFAPLDADTLTKAATDLTAEGLLITEGTRWRLTESGLLLADRVALELLERLG